jgi:hypothetical protein
MKKIFTHNLFTATFNDEGTGENNRYFSFTGEIDGSLGANGDRIAKIYPPFQILEDLHLSNSQGVPKYAIENGFYHFKESGYKIKSLESYWKVKLTVKQKHYLQAHLETMKKNEKDVKKHVAVIVKKLNQVWSDKVKAAYKLVNETPSDLTEIDETISLDDYSEPDKVRALAAFLDVHFSIITEDRDNEYTAQGIEYTVYTDDEADKAWDEELDNYVEECLMPEIKDETLKRYFDFDRWKEDAQNDGRGHSLSRYDGCENEQIIKVCEGTDNETKETYYIYRQS